MSSYAEYFKDKSDETLIGNFKALHSVIYGEAQCFGSSDMAEYHFLEEELKKRGYTIGSVPTFYREEPWLEFRRADIRVVFDNMVEGGIIEEDKMPDGGVLTDEDLEEIEERIGISVDRITSQINFMLHDEILIYLEEAPDETYICSKCGKESLDGVGYKQIPDGAACSECFNKMKEETP